MGRDKARLDFHGMPQIEYVYDLLRQHCPKVFLSKRIEQKAYKRIAVINDRKELSDHGPIAGILSAMKEYPAASWLVVACDLPQISDQTIQMLLKNRNPQKVATAFWSMRGRLPEPLCAIWEGHAYQSILKLFDQGVYCPRKILINSPTKLIKQTNPHWLDNINTPEEFHRLVV
jgi:molybdopterin-guanine dinucleotide biosynthesis protein A